MKAPAKVSRNPISKWSIMLIAAGVITLLAFRYMAAIDGGISHIGALRTYVFWAAVTAPVAVLADLLVRTILSYRIVRLAVARVRSNDR